MWFDINQMHLGLVCQLRYDGSGALLYQKEPKDVVVPFVKADLRLVIGQTVTFSLRPGHTEAVEITSAERPITASSAERTTKSRLQRSLWRFHNATAEERHEMLDRAEADLETWMTELDGIDGTQLCRLVNRCMGWLRAVSLERNGGARQAEAVAFKGRNFQGRIRRLLIRCLEHLDLTDGPTFQLLEISLNYLWHLLQKTNLKQLDTLTSTRRQWNRLQELLATPLGEGYGEHETSMTEDLQSDKGAVDGGVYHPRERVRNLPSVFASEKVMLRCPACGMLISSAWRWRHPNNGKVHVLVPHNGHFACTKKTGKRCLWQTLSSIAPKTDHFSHLAFCRHNRREGICKDCGGREMCMHNRQRANCRICKKPRGKTSQKNVHRGWWQKLFPFTESPLASSVWSLESRSCH